MMYAPIDIANWFLATIDRDAGDSITNLKLQKLVYYAQAWALVLLEDELFEEDFEAWAHGPILLSLWQIFRDAGWDALPPPPVDWSIEFDEETIEILMQVYDVYGGMHAKQLEELVYSETPWREARRGLPLEARTNNIISKESMRQFYASLHAELLEDESKVK